MAKDINKQSLSMLIETLRHAPVESRRAAVSALAGALGNYGVGTDYIRIIPIVQNWYRCLKVERGGFAEETLLRALFEGELGVRTEAWKSLDDLVEQLKTLDKDSLNSSVSALNAKGADAREKAATYLAKAEWKPENDQQRAAFLVGAKKWDEAASLGSSAIPALEIALGDTNVAVREMAVTALGTIRDGSSLDALAIALLDSSAVIQSRAAKALGSYGDKATTILVEALGCKSAHTAGLAAKALGQSGDPLAIEPLFNAFCRRNGLLEHVASALGQIGIAAVNWLIPKLRENEAATAKLVVRSLICAGEVALEPLIRLYEESDTDIKELVVGICAAMSISDDSLQMFDPRTLLAIQRRRIENICEYLIGNLRIGSRDYGGYYNLDNMSESRRNFDRKVVPLVTLIETQGAHLSIHALERIAALGDNCVYYDSSCNDSIFNDVLSTARLRQLARQEILRRDEEEKKEHYAYLARRERCLFFAKHRYCQTCNIGLSPEQQFCTTCGAATEPLPQMFAFAWAREEFPDVICKEEDFDRIIAV